MFRFGFSRFALGPAEIMKTSSDSQIDIVCAFVAADCSLSDEDVCEDISECVHAECAAFFGREQARQHGVHVEKVVHSF